MMKNTVFEWMEQAFSLMTWVIAISLFLMIHYTCNKTLEELKYNVQEERTLYDSVVSKEPYRVKGSEIIGEIMQGLKYKITIDHVEVPVDQKIEEFDVTKVSLHRNYKVGKILDQHGNIVQINYIRE